MADLLEIKIDSSRVNNYRKIKSETPSFLDRKAFILIDSYFQDKMLESMKKLLSTYKVDHEHLDYFLFIIGQHYYLYETLEEQIQNSFECHEPLKFLQSYLVQTENLKTEGIKEDSENKEELIKQRLDNRYLEIVNPLFKNEIPIRLRNTDFVVKGIYQLFKKQYNYSLKEVLKPYEEIPSLNIINQLVEENNNLINYVTRYLIPEISLDLLDYLKTYMVGQLSRKQYLFLFDLLYLYGIFLLDDNEDTHDYKVTETFEVPDYPSTEKTAYLKRVIHRYNKYIKQR
nr:hypothetical protein [uncultured Pedobacter sp.]